MHAEGLEEECGGRVSRGDGYASEVGHGEECAEVNVDESQRTIGDTLDTGEEHMSRDATGQGRLAAGDLTVDRAPARNSIFGFSRMCVLDVTRFDESVRRMVELDVRRCWHANGRPTLQKPIGPVYELLRQVGATPILMILLLSLSLISSVLGVWTVFAPHLSAAVSLQCVERRQR